jgi:hypothetical protein
MRRIAGHWISEVMRHGFAATMSDGLGMIKNRAQLFLPAYSLFVPKVTETHQPRSVS